MGVAAGLAVFSYAVPALLPTLTRASYWAYTTLRVNSLVGYVSPYTSRVINAPVIKQVYNFLFDHFAQIAKWSTAYIAGSVYAKGDHFFGIKPIKDTAKSVISYIPSDFLRSIASFFIMPAKDVITDNKAVLDPKSQGRIENEIYKDCAASKYTGMKDYVVADITESNLADLLSPKSLMYRTKHVSVSDDQLNAIKAEVTKISQSR
ncbi:MAG: hypothetical protein J0G32_08400 [Alphaproteobacteria bacterium]|nr:hypothetical protein [Alphaproteobacteria bacterium]OJV15127.1 MAG: hypothetical protein BGO27_06790 [Alphaproteobacteria bacterium 33-17]